MNSSLFKNAYGQFRNWFQSSGIFIVSAIGGYFFENEQWTLRGLFIATWPTILAYGFTWLDHKKTQKAVLKAAVTGETPTITEGELK